MKRLVFFVLCIIPLSAGLPALEWPVDTHDFLRLFGQCVGENIFEQGITFENTSTVRAADDGILLITLDKRHGAGVFPSTLGNALIVIHDDGLQTIYGNIEDTSVFRNRITVEANTVVGRTGNSGWGTPNALLFQVIDNQKKAYINPLLLLPSVNDKIPPQIRNIILVNDQNTAFQMAGQKSLRQGSYELYAEIFDTATAGGYTFSPFRITIFVNGVSMRTIPFETITQKDGAFYLGNTAFTDTLLYRKKNTLYLGKIILNRGKSDILITARDITGNETTERFSLQTE